jgi:ribosomal protein S18 acetylase RimI-like enzyme
VDSGLDAPEFNIIGRSSLHPRFAGDRIEAAIKHFRHKDKEKSRAAPFTWWVGPLSGQGSLDTTLVGLGLTLGREQWALILALETLNLPSSTPSGLDIKRVSTKEGVEHFAKVLAGDPANEHVTKLFAETAEKSLASTAPTKLYVGYNGSEPVVVTEAFYAQGLVGIYNIATAAAAKGKGYGPALTITALKDAKKMGTRHALILAGEAEKVGYQKIGFKPVGKFAEYQMK